MAEEFTYYTIHDIVTVKTNRDVPVPSYFETSPDRPDDFDADITFVQESLDIDRSDEEKKRSGAFFYWTDESALFIEYELPVIDAQMSLRDLEGDTEIRFSETFVKQGDIMQLFEVVLSLKFIQKGYALIHTGCLNYDGEGVLITALPDTGKTSTCLSLLNGEDIRFLSDDMAIVSRDGDVYSYPRRVNISPYTLTGEVMSRSDDLVSKVKQRLANSRLEILFGTILSISMGDRKEVPREYIDDRSHVENLFVISGGADSTREIGSDEEKARKILVNTLELLDPFKIYTLNFYYHLFDFDIFDLLEKQREIVTEAVSGVTCVEVKSNEVKKYPETIESILREADE